MPRPGRPRPVLRTNIHGWGQKKLPKCLTFDFEETNQSPGRSVLRTCRTEGQPLLRAIIRRYDVQMMVRSRPASHTLPWPSVKIIGSIAQAANLRFSGDIAALTAADDASAYDTAEKEQKR